MLKQFGFCRGERATAASRWAGTDARKLANASTSGESDNEMNPSYQTHLTGAADLKTTYEAIRAGFIALALEKNRRVTPLIAQARALREAASQAKTATELLTMQEIQRALVTASGISDKAANHLNDDDKRKAVLGLVENFLEPAGEKFVEELVFRFLLIRGDTLGGSMRNAGGFMAQCKLSRSLIAHLKLAAKPFRWLHSAGDVWMDMPVEDEAGIELHLRGLSWENAGQPRTLLYNVNIPLVRNNIDLVLLNCNFEQCGKQIIGVPAAYLALGELKGGIDPAGADEHWKTASTALKRIRESFSRENLNPHTFFIGAAIEMRMAEEIWEMLQTNVIENAANLTDEKQLASISRWICLL